MADNFGHEWVVRLLFSPYDQERNPMLISLVDSLRGAGVVRVPRPNGSDNIVLDLPAPAGVESQSWANGQAERMSALGLNAAAAPMWPLDDCDWSVE